MRFVNSLISVLNTEEEEKIIFVDILNWQVFPSRYRWRLKGSHLEAAGPETVMWAYILASKKSNEKDNEK